MDCLEYRPSCGLLPINAAEHAMIANLEAVLWRCA